MAEPELERLNVDLLIDTMREWLQVNETAAALFDKMPDDAKRIIWDQPPNWMPAVAAMASVHPSTREFAHAQLVDAIGALERLAGSLSHPLGRVTKEAVAGEGQAMGEADDVRELRREFSEIRRLLEEHLAVCPHADAVLRLRGEADASRREAS